MLSSLEYVVWALFALFIAVQLGALLMIGLARVLKSFGVFRENPGKGGFMGFLEGFS